MRWLLSSIRGFGAAGAAANARAELEAAHTRTVQAALVARRVQHAGPIADRSAIAQARVA